MIQSYLTGPILLSSNTEAISFEKDCVRTRSAYPNGGWLCHSEASPLYKITKGGNYRVSFNANVSGITAGTPVSLALFSDGVEVPGTRIIQDITTAGEYYSVSFEKILPICFCGNAALSIQSIPSVTTGATLPGTATATQPALIQNANFIIEKEC